MSQSQAIVGTERETTAETQDAGAERTAQVLQALQDADCRTMLAATADEPRSAKELSESHDIPLSTTYRKLDLLTDAGLLEETMRVRKSGKHTTAYGCAVQSIEMAVDAEDGFRLEVSGRTEQGPARPSLRGRR
ncbi:MAG: ArsR/SmtB family transcription factor [Haloarculaceae archaeon]